MSRSCFVKIGSRGDLKMVFSNQKNFTTTLDGVTVYYLIKK
jgi:hypothetical protein